MFPVAPRPAATVAARAGFPLPSPKGSPTLRAGSPWDTEAGLSLGQTTGVRGTAGLASWQPGRRELPKAWLSSLEEAPEDSVNVAAPRERQGREGGAAVTYPWLPAQQLGGGHQVGLQKLPTSSHGLASPLLGQAGSASPALTLQGQPGSLAAKVPYSQGVAACHTQASHR